MRGLGPRTKALPGRWIAASVWQGCYTQASAEDLCWFTLEGGLDHLRHGITATYNFNYGGHSAETRARLSMS